MYNQNNQKLKPTEPRYYFGSVGGRRAAQTNGIYSDLVAMYPQYIRAAGFQNFGTTELMKPRSRFLVERAINTDLTYYFRLGGEHSIKGGLSDGSDWWTISSIRMHTRILFLDGGNHGLMVRRILTLEGHHGDYRASLANDTGSFGKSIAHRYAFYLQDSWTIANRITMNYGVRAEKRLSCL